MKTKETLIACLLILAQVLKAENKLSFSPYGNKYVVLDAKEQRFGIMIGHKILDTIVIDKDVPNYLREKSFCNPNKIFLVKKLTSYIYSKYFFFYTKIDSNQFVIRQGKSIKLFSVFVGKSERKFHWNFLLFILITIIIGSILSKEIKFRITLEPLLVILALFVCINLFFALVISIFFEQITIKELIFLTILSILLFNLSIFITSIIKKRITVVKDIEKFEESTIK